MQTFRQRREASSGEDGGPVRLANTSWVDLKSSYGQIYRILIACPPGPAPSGGFPAIVVLDGNALFATAVETARQQAGRPEVTGVAPAVLVGIGYPGETAFSKDRRMGDLLPEQGSDRLLDFISGDVLPLVEGSAPVSVERRSLVGHSLGGLMVLHTLLSRPEMFRSYIAGSPSIWWNDRAILDVARQSRPMRADGRAARLLVTVGGAEEVVTSRDSSERHARVRSARMIENAVELVACLAADPGVVCDYVSFPGENHMSTVPAMLARAVRFALSDGVGETRL